MSDLAVAAVAAVAGMAAFVVSMLMYKEPTERYVPQPSQMSPLLEPAKHVADAMTVMSDNL